uniref:Uncharacterized protein n=1 Tax=Phlebotomus papatasi TaxID=29031 RepID=A0A1B0DJH2_PHLPP
MAMRVDGFSVFLATIVSTIASAIAAEVSMTGRGLVEKKIPYPVEKHVPYKVEKYIQVPVPHPIPVKVPVVKTIFHKVKSHGWH